MASLSQEEFRRYGRQMQVPEFNALEGQLALKSAKILVIGAGGLGSSALLYLGAAGVGKIGIQDFDHVEETNLHRQVIHDTSSVGMLKCDSAKRRINLINPNVEVVTHPEPINPVTGPAIVKQYDLVLDCTDNPVTRYIISDLCVIAGKILVSASAVKADGQLSILNFPPNVGPCYRCFYPTPPRPDTISSCSGAGVIGSCVGLVGVMMATETTKILTGYYSKEEFKPFLSMYTGYGPQQALRTFKMRNKKDDCLCNNQQLTEESIQSLDYDQWCGKVNYNLLTEDDRLDREEFVQSIPQADLVLDVRPEEQYNIAKIDNCTNVPYSELKKFTAEQLEEKIGPKDSNLLVLCRFGNASQQATNFLKLNGYTNVKDLKGGLRNYSEGYKFNVYW